MKVVADFAAIVLFFLLIIALAIAIVSMVVLAVLWGSCLFTDMYFTEEYIVRIGDTIHNTYRISCGA